MYKKKYKKKDKENGEKSNVGPWLYMILRAKQMWSYHLKLVKLLVLLILILDRSGGLERDMEQGFVFFYVHTYYLFIFLLSFVVVPSFFFLLIPPSPIK